MLNEGYALYKSLERCGIIKAQSFTKRHRDLTNPGKSDGLIIGIDEKGHVAELEFRSKMEMTKLWTTTRGNHNSFPAIKLQRPLWKVGSNDILRKHLKELKKNEQKKKELLFSHSKELNITKTEINKWQGLQERVRELQPFFETKDRDFAVFHDLMTRFQLADKYDAFLIGLFKRIHDSSNDIPYSLIENLLIGNKKEKDKDEYKAEVRVILDVSDWGNASRYSNRIASPNIEQYVSDCLFNMDMATQSENGSTPLVSGLSGKPKLLVNDKYPQLTLPIGKAYLFSAAGNIPCLERYGKISTEIFPVGKDEADDISRSLKGIINEDRKGKTWYPLNKNEFLIVYLESMPNINVNKAYLLGGVSKDDFSESSYEAISSVAIEALKGNKLVKANDLIRLFALRKADPGRTQVSLQRTYTKSDLVKADECWREASQNIPYISIPFFRKEIENTIIGRENISKIILEFVEDAGAKAIFLSPQCPFPADLVQLTKKQWFQPKKKNDKAKRESSDVPGISLDNIYDVFFASDDGGKQLIEGLLRTTLQRTEPLIIGIGQADHKNKTNEFRSETRITVLRTISAFAIYLYKLGIKKEDYMKDTFFYVGRFLSLVDTLHYEYCDKVRGGNIPPQLLGNTHLPIALDNPVSAFDMLSRRIGIYQAWTKKGQDNQDALKLARWAVGQLGKVTDSLSEKTLPDHTTSAERAQILLGYLARADKKTDTVSETLVEEVNSK